MSAARAALDRARGAGLEISLVGARIRVQGPVALEPLARPLVEELRPEVLVALKLERLACAACGAHRRPGGNLVPTYWGHGSRLCSQCCVDLTERHDHRGAWPRRPGGDAAGITDREAVRGAVGALVTLWSIAAPAAAVAA